MEDRNSLATRKCILEAAQGLFAAHGYHGASIRDIVRACGVSNAALYYHFGNKQNLYAEVLRSYIAAVVEHLHEADPGEGSCRTRLLQVAIAYARVILHSENLLQTLLRDAAHFDPEDIARLLPDLSDQIPEAIAAIVEDGIAAGEVRQLPSAHTGMLMMGMVNALAVRRLYTKARTTLQQDVDLAIETLFDGIGTE
ncbi:MAG: TetR/AcrR family transcriptional regulator [Anaerolineae bacterium]|jgi:AcrR family transcriptional regulator